MKILTLLQMKYSIFGKKNKEESNEIIFFEWRKLGHKKVECPHLKKKKYSRDKKKKSMMVTWDNSNSEKSSNSDNEEAKICLMADTEDEVE